MRQEAVTRYATQPQNGVWTQAETFPINLKQYPEKDAHLHMILVVKDQSQFVNLSSFYQSIYLRFQTLAQSYNPDKLDRFNQSFTKLIQELITDSDSLAIEIAVVYQFGKHLFVGGGGGTTATLIRNGEIGKILDSSHGVTSAQGVLLEGDIILLASSQFYSTVPYMRLRQLLLERYTQVSIETVTSELVVYFDQQAQTDGIGFIFGHYTDTEEPAKAHSTNSFGKLQKRFTRLKWPKPFGRQVIVRKKSVDRRRQRLSIVLVLVLLALLSLSISLGWWRRQRIQEAQAYAAIADPARVLMEEALKQKNLNMLLARGLLQQARSELQTQLEEFNPNSRYYPQLTELYAQIEAAYQDVSGETQIEPQQFMDLAFIEPDLSADRLGVWEDRLILLDTVNNRVVTIGASTKDPSQLINDSRLTGATLTSGAVDVYYVLTDEGVVSLSPDADIQTVIETDSDWRNPIGFEAFAGNIYILDSQQNELWRYRGVVGDAFVRQRWLAPGVNPDFSQVVDMVIDGDIWVLDSDGSVRRYSRGVGETIDLIGVETSVEAKALGISENYIYIFDQSQSKVLVYDKTGQYNKQFLWSDIGLVTDMVVFEDNIFLLANDKLWSIENK